MRRIVLFAGTLLLALPMEAYSQCGCNFVINANSPYVFDGVKMGVKPGNKICFANGQRADIMIMNVHGTAAQPVVFTNMCDGKVLIKGNAGTGRLIYMGNVSYVRITGSANPSEAYGIEVQTGVQGIDFRDLSTNVEADHLYLHDLGYSGINAKTDPTCDPATWRGNFTMRDVLIHDNKIINTGGEGIYIGESHYHTTVTVTPCNLQAQEHEIIGCQIYNNILQNIGRDGIQVGSVTSGGFIHHNSIYNFATLHLGYDASGIQINPGTNANIYNNVIDLGYGFGVFAGGRGGSHLYNNIISNCGMGGITSAAYAPVDVSGFIFSNNTLVNNANLGIQSYANNTPNICVNNIIVAPATGTFMFIDAFAPGIVWAESNNIKTADINSIKFVNAGAKNYRLQTTSPAKDAGISMVAKGISTDLDNLTRPSGPAFDIGAYEFQAGSVPNIPPVPNAGTDINIILPITVATLTGTATDPDGTITAYSWTKVSGPAATLNNPASAILSLAGLVQGSYVFRLTVTDNNAMTASDDVTVTVNPAGTPPVVTVISRFNFTNMTQSVAGWTNAVGQPHAAVITARDPATGFTVSSVATTQWPPLQNASPISAFNGGAANGTIQPAAVVLTQWLNFGAPYGATVNGVVQGDNVSLSGLNPAKTYLLQMGASRASGSGPDRYGNVEYRVKGTDPKLLLITDNTSNQIEYASVTPDAQGKIGISARKRNGDSPMQIGYIGWLVVTENAAAPQAPPPANAPPVANAGTDKSISLPTTTITLTGTGTDSDGTIVSYGWTKVSGALVTLVNQFTSILTINALLPGTYVFRLRVIDNDGTAAYDDVTVTVAALGGGGASATERAAPENEPIEPPEPFDFLDKQYPGGYKYSVNIFTESGQVLYSGEWTKERYFEVFVKEGLYLYYVNQDGKRVDAGKVMIVK